MVTGSMLDRSESMTQFLGLAADSRLLGQDRFNLPAAEQSPKAPVPRHEHDRLIIAGSTLTAVSLVAGMLLLLYGGRLAPARRPAGRRPIAGWHSSGQSAMNPEAAAVLLSAEK